MYCIVWYASNHKMEGKKARKKKHNEIPLPWFGPKYNMRKDMPQRRMWYNMHTLHEFHSRVSFHDAYLWLCIAYVLFGVLCDYIWCSTTRLLCAPEVMRTLSITLFSSERRAAAGTNRLRVVLWIDPRCLWGRRRTKYLWTPPTEQRMRPRGQCILDVMCGEEVRKSS